MPHSTELRWLVVWKRLWFGHSARQVSAALEPLRVSRRFQSKLLEHFARTGDVVRAGPAAPRARMITPALEIELLHAVLDSPTWTLRQHALELQLQHGITVSLPTLCRAMRHLRLSHQRLQHFALRRDEQRAQAFWTEIVTFYSLDDILVGDETAKCIGALRRTHGWGQVGITPIDRVRAVHGRAAGGASTRRRQHGRLG